MAYITHILVWYHLIGVELKIKPQKWLCAACEGTNEGSARIDDVIFPYIDMCLIT